MRYQLFHGILGFQEISGVLRSIKVLRDIRGFKRYQGFPGILGFQEISGVSRDIKVSRNHMILIAISVSWDL